MIPWKNGKMSSNWCRMQTIWIPLNYRRVEVSNAGAVAAMAEGKQVAKYASFGGL